MVLQVLTPLVYFNRRLGELSRFANPLFPKPLPSFEGFVPFPFFRLFSGPVLFEFVPGLKKIIPLSQLLGPVLRLYMAGHKKQHATGKELSNTSHWFRC